VGRAFDLWVCGLAIGASTKALPVTCNPVQSQKSKLEQVAFGVNVGFLLMIVLASL